MSFPIDFASISSREIIDSFIREKPRSFFRLLRNGCSWGNYLSNTIFETSSGLQPTIEMFTKSISVFSLCDLGRESLYLIKRTARLVLVVQGDGPLNGVAWAAKKVAIAFFSTLESGLRVIKMAHTWGIHRIKKIHHIDGISAVIGIILSINEMAKRIFVLVSLYKIDQGEEEKKAETWQRLALSINIFIIDVLSMMAFVVIIPPPLFLILSSAILVLEISLFITSKIRAKPQLLV